MIKTLLTKSPTITSLIIQNLFWLRHQYESHREIEKNDDNTVQLGRSLRIADKFQFEFAKSISQLSKADKILVDYPISCTKRTQPLYPDILFIKNDSITSILEIKIDLGFLNLDNFGIAYDKSNKTYSYKKINNTFKKNIHILLHLKRYGIKRKKIKSK